MVNDLTCPTISVCYAIDGSAGVTAGIQTSNSGATWTTLSLPLQDISGIVCFSATHCNVGGLAPTAIGPTTDPYPTFMATTIDGGATWTLSQSFAEHAQIGFGCATPSQCYISGLDAGFDTPTFYLDTTSNAGQSWTESTGNILQGQSCPTADTCTELEYPGGGPPLTSIGLGGSTIISNNGTDLSGGLFNNLETGISCPTVAVCYAVDDSSSGGIYAAASPAVTSQPASQYYDSGQSLTFNAAASGVPTPSAQWQYSCNGGTTWSNFSGVTGTQLTIGPLNGFANNCQVRAVFTNAFGSSTSSTATMSLATTSVVLPSNGASEAGKEALDAIASAGATQVQYELTGGSLLNQVIATGTPTIYGWLALWNTTTVPNGTYTLQSVASYPGGVSATSAPITVTVNNTPPSTAVLIPSNGTIASGTAAVLDASASANVTTVTYELTGGGITNQVIATGTPTLYGWLTVWNTTSVPNGIYSLQTVASYAGGVSGTSTPVSITVAN
jgi:hypothetical protein